MTLRIQIVVIAIAVLAIILTFVLIKKGLLGLKITLPWMIVFVLVILFAAIPHLMEKVSHLFGIYDPVNMVFFLGIVFLVMVIYSLTVSIYTNRQKTRDLIQKVAYLEEKLEQKQEQESDDR
ncbi:MAG: DUF2304 domain-containing protein [Lachnospiraceae bacterium]|nr:DUF2304 domain-containing protein [Lachnospiraceae bacterium]